MSGAISRKSARNWPVEMSFERISVSLCWTSGWPTTTTFSVIFCLSSPIKTPCRRSRCEAAARRPDAFRPRSAVPHPGERQAHRIEAEAGAERRCQAVEERDGERPPFDDRLLADGQRAARQIGIARLDDAEIEEEPAIAVFGKAGQRVAIGDGDPRLFERLDERIGEPLAQLVERNEATARIGRLGARMPPDIAERNAGKAL